MSNSVSHILVVAILLIALSLIAGDTFCSSGDPGGWGELSGGLRLRARVDSEVIRGSTITIDAELLADHDSLWDACHRFATGTQGTHFTLRLVEEATGVSRQMRREPGWHNFPAVDISLDSVSDSIPLCKVGFFRSSERWPAPGRAWGQLELFIPPGMEKYWSGMLISAPFEFTIVEPDFDMEKITFVIPTELVLVEGPRISFDSPSVDTITVLSRRGYHRVSITKCGGYQATAFHRGGNGDEDSTDLPFLPRVNIGRPIPGTMLFVDGETTIELVGGLYEAQNKPEWHHGVHFNGPRRALWEKTYRLTISKNELLELTPNEEDQYDYRTYIVPSSLHLDSDKSLSFRKFDTSPQEFQVKKGNAIGYSVLLNQENAGCWEGYPQSPLTKLPRKPSCDNPVQVTFRVFQYPDGGFQGRDCRWGSSQTLWISKCTIDRDSGTYDLEASGGFGPRPMGWRRWRQCRIPRTLNLDVDGQILFDSSDMLTVDFKPWADGLPVIKISVDEEPARLVSTQLCNPLAVWHPKDQNDTSIDVRIEIITAVPPEVPDPASARAFWSRSYRLYASGALGRQDDRGKQ